MDRRTMMIGTGFAAVFGAARALPQNADNSKRLNALFDQFMKETLDISPLFHDAVLLPGAVPLELVEQIYV